MEKDISILEHIAPSTVFQGLPGQYCEEMAAVIQDKFFRRGQIIISETLSRILIKMTTFLLDKYTIGE